MKPEKCNCDKCRMEYDKLEKRYHPYCLEYDTWLYYDRRYSVNLREEHSYRSYICYEHGRPVKK